MIRTALRACRFALVILSMGAGGCATSSRPNFVVALPNGYQIIRGGKAAEPMIVKRSGGVVVPGPVDSYTVIRDVVVGSVKPGFFVLDTRTGQVENALAENAYQEKLKSLNIAPLPELSPPVLPK